LGTTLDFEAREIKRGKKEKNKTIPRVSSRPPTKEIHRADKKKDLSGKKVTFSVYLPAYAYTPLASLPFNLERKKTPPIPPRSINNSIFFSGFSFLPCPPSSLLQGPSRIRLQLRRRARRGRLAAVMRRGDLRGVARGRLEGVSGRGETLEVFAVVFVGLFFGLTRDERMSFGGRGNGKERKVGDDGTGR
jgi:hypothetical protein